MKANVTLPVDHTPDYYPSVKIHSGGCIEEIVNGPGLIARELVVGRNDTRMHLISIGALRHQQSKVNETDQIPMRRPQKASKRLAKQRRLGQKGPDADRPRTDVPSSKCRPYCSWRKIAIAFVPSESLNT
jgi:hypothetical protein